MRPLRLHEAATQRWRRQCPCCGVHTRSAYVRKGKPTPRDQRTVAHVDAVSHGGDPHVWLYACHKCNNAQGWFSFDSWYRLLILTDDPRAERVAEVARFVEAWRQSRKEAA